MIMILNVTCLCCRAPAEKTGGWKGKFNGSGGSNDLFIMHGNKFQYFQDCNIENSGLYKLVLNGQFDWFQHYSILLKYLRVGNMFPKDSMLMVLCVCGVCVHLHVCVWRVFVCICVCVLLHLCVFVCACSLASVSVCVCVCRWGVLSLSWTRDRGTGQTNTVRRRAVWRTGWTPTFWTCRVSDGLMNGWPLTSFVKSLD